jgi:uncharacterized protein
MRRFIAGAVCPACREMDRVVVETLPEGRRRRCVHCGHSETMDDAPASSGAQPGTRFSRPRERATATSVVRIVDPHAAARDEKN